MIRHSHLGESGIRQQKIATRGGNDRNELFLKPSLRRLFFCGSRESFGKALFGLAARDDEVIVISVASPGTRRHITDFDKLPIRDVGWSQAEVIANRRRNIQTSPTVQIWFWPLILEYILEMIGAKRAAILPLRITGAIAFPYGDPATFAY